MSQKHWEDELGTNLDSESITEESFDEPDILSKDECERFFREEVKDWLDLNGKELFGNGMPIPHLVRSNVTNTPYKPPYKKQKTSIDLVDEKKVDSQGKTYFVSSKTNKK